MSISEMIQQIDDLKSKIDALRPIPDDTMDRIMRKFRLDWNFHSNNIEGNSLTFGETKAFLLHGLTAAGKPLKDHLDIKGHNEAIHELEDFIKENKPLTQFIIRSFHKLLLVEPYETEAIDQNGKKILKKFQPGKYKEFPNHVKTITGETLTFTDPLKVEEEMQALLIWHEKEMKERMLHPLVFAATFHHAFIKIHPFDDGNGRLARILMNLILIKNEYPPVIIKTEDKENYLRALQIADGGEINTFVEYVGQQLIRSLEIMLKGVKGENIEEPGDLDKEIQLVLKQIEISKKDIVKAKKDALNLNYTFRNSLFPLMKKLEIITYKFKEFYHEIENESIITLNSGHQITFQDFVDFEYWVDHSEQELDMLRSVIILGRLKGFKHSSETGNDYSFALNIRFNDFNYEIQTGTAGIKEIGLYDQIIPTEKIEKICNYVGREILIFIKNIQ